MQLQRLSEKTLTISMVAKRCDSPNPERLNEAINLWKDNLTWAEISNKVNIPERTLRRYLRSFGYSRGYDFVSMKLKGRPKSELHKKNLSIARISKGLGRKENNPNWRGGTTSIWLTPEYRLWRKSVFTRDNFTCMGCNIRNGQGKTIELNAHHILPRRDFPHLTFELSNGITLCVPCHNKTKKKEYLSVNIWKQRVSNN